MIGAPGKWPWKNCFVEAHGLDRVDPLAQLDRLDPVDQQQRIAMRQGLEDLAIS
jgi:hypothetical protein